MIQALLADAESKQLTLKTVELWLRKLKAVFYGTDAVLDEFQYELLRRTADNRKKDKIRAFLSPSRNSLSFQMSMSHKIRDINIENYQGQQVKILVNPEHSINKYK
ncbi:hypothetical protein RJ639_025531 [Escallonia herrerae]|uniref:Disease resistance N-terminal domain-containing protein n=1 Tax=Escallonia herrerae TaxID=1293975 RepID=A0AA88UY52_9ASTE|nr:hypothetical protein RJ639_025531 [Escallonia herrerae]